MNALYSKTAKAIRVPHVTMPTTTASSSFLPSLRNPARAARRNESTAHIAKTAEEASIPARHAKKQMSNAMLHRYQRKRYQKLYQRESTSHAISAAMEIMEPIAAI